MTHDLHSIHSSFKALLALLPGKLLSNVNPMMQEVTERVLGGMASSVCDQKHTYGGIISFSVRVSSSSFAPD